MAAVLTVVFNGVLIVALIGVFVLVLSVALIAGLIRARIVVVHDVFNVV